MTFLLNEERQPVASEIVASNLLRRRDIVPERCSALLPLSLNSSAIISDGVEFVNMRVLNRITAGIRHTQQSVCSIRCCDPLTLPLYIDDRSTSTFYLRCQISELNKHPFLTLSMCVPSANQTSSRHHSRFSRRLRPYSRVEQLQCDHVILGRNCQRRLTDDEFECDTKSLKNDVLITEFSARIQVRRCDESSLSLDGTDVQ